MTDDFIQSPCIGLCGLNEERICGGCFRSDEEISQWNIVDNEQRRAILDSAELRRQQQED